MAKQPSKSESQQGSSFEEAMVQLEAIVRALEEGELGLNESLARYEQGIKLLRQCHDLLQRAERRIELLTGVDAEGNPICTPFEEPSLSLDEKAQQRSRRRSTSPSPEPPPSPAPSSLLFPLEEPPVDPEDPDADE